MPTVTIDGVEIEVPAGVTALQACEMAGVEIPRFCYHERLSVAGNCRMCLVEVSPGPPKPAASCALPVADGMEIKTDSEMVKKARNGVMEFLLINHPLDCPICDQGGECDLQDQAMAYGRDGSRFEEHKRAVKDKHMGPLVKTIMTRCIHCTRCVRFATEIAGVPELGLLGRGEHAEITTYLEKSLDSELSANVIDLCPVGALTSKPYAFVSRPWELSKTESIDVLDAVGASIRVDARQTEVLRILPRLHEDVNEEWLADKSRYACDALSRQRLDRPYVRKDGKLAEASWDEAFAAIADKMKGLDGSRIAAVAGDLCDAESMFALKSLMDSVGSPNMDCRQDGAKLPAGPRAAYLMNSSIAGLETADAVLLIGTNPRWEAPLVNTRLRKAWLQGGATIAAVGPQIDLTYPCENLGAGPDTLKAIADGTHPFAETLKNAERPVVIVGMGALARADGDAVLAAARALADNCNIVRDDWNGFNVLHTAAARVGGLDLGFVPGVDGRDVAGIIAGAGAGDIELVYLLGADEIDTAALGDAFVVYQGHHGDAGAHRADVILPGAAYTEKNGTYVNTEGRVQLARQAVQPPGEAREDWTIIRALSGVIGANLDYVTLGDVRAALAAANPVFEQVDQVAPASWDAFGTAGDMDAAAFESPIGNYYMTDAISRASETMAECTREFVSGNGERTGTDG
ncbi:MAG: NADH-quinone oxidoreductase subunit G [Rhodospirillaceae bacterium]|jgi:NADH-quinone oxidoreductase subunit G|nr:NADH-quinone oxidoreductase subunit G [Rhodospirillaceae bacterium]MBT3807953.1 NADH-quinone oxidoreductase subunit G [Rhodospirillaceae bacterium]MBT4770999.1 NADH-quinone oxidoreductase subunit G [Rhodospirillaceae bacterium]MBT5359206.1 NADH-quinone oxidoreductase subunit G [Rhodospirillaceae bacterium]MBT5769076.1 NADH-quinone oxidoreductase subunit G [Rhodospirillaceae bacterium]